MIVIISLNDDSNGQMIVLEAILFAIMILLALIVISNISPAPQATINRYSNQLKIWADDSIRALDSMRVSSEYRIDNNTYFYESRLVQYIVLNDTYNATIFFNNSLPSDVGYNIYISNNNDTVMWYNGEKFWGGKIGEVSRAKFIVTIDYDKWIDVSVTPYKNREIISGYKGNEYIFVLEVWNIL